MSPPSSPLENCRPEKRDEDTGEVTRDIRSVRARASQRPQGQLRRPHRRPSHHPEASCERASRYLGEPKDGRARANRAASSTSPRVVVLILCRCPKSHRGSSAVEGRGGTQKAHESTRYTDPGSSGRYPRPRKGRRQPRHRFCHRQEELFSCSGERTTAAHGCAVGTDLERSSSRPFTGQTADSRDAQYPPTSFN